MFNEKEVKRQRNTAQVMEQTRNTKKQTKDLAQISTYMKLTQTTGPTLGGQKPKGRKNSTLKPGKRRPQTQ